MDLLSSFTALPNLHPAVVHFPIALAVVALLIDSISIVLRSHDWLRRAAVFQYGLAALSAIAAYLAGRQAAKSVGALPANAEAVLAEHADLALLVLVSLCAAAGLRLSGLLLDREKSLTKVMTFLGFVFMVAANGLLVATADQGGSLVYEHGVAVAAESRAATPSPTLALEDVPPDYRQRLIRSGDGSIDWRPSSADGAVLASIFRPADGSTLENVTALATPESDQQLRAKITGRTVLIFPETFGDVVVTAVMDLSDFEGTFGLGHHIQSASEGVFFTMSSGGGAELIRRSADGDKQLGVASIEWSGLSNARLRTSVAGRHLKGQFGDLAVVHGHGSSGDDGAAGLLPDGVGVVGIRRINVEPVRGN